MKEASAFPLSYTMSPVKELCTEKADCYLVKLQLNQKGQAIYGHLFRPKKVSSKGCPVVLCPPGAGIKTIKNRYDMHFMPSKDLSGLNSKYTASTLRGLKKCSKKSAVPSTEPRTVI